MELDKDDPWVKEMEKIRKSDAIEKTFEDLANERTKDPIEINGRVCDYRAMFELGRNSAIIEIELKEALCDISRFVNTKESAKEILLKKIEEFEKRGLIQMWEPQFEISLNEETGAIDITSKDEETAKYFQKIVDA